MPTTAKGNRDRLDGPQVGEALYDVHGGELLRFAPAAATTAVNFLTLRNAATGGRPGLLADGGDPDVDFYLAPHGLGVIMLDGPLLVTQGVTINGALAVHGSTTLGDAPSDLLTISGDVHFLKEQTRLQAGPTDLAFTNASGSANNLLLADAGQVTLRNTLLLTAGQIQMDAAASQLRPGGTSFAIRNHADTRDNFLMLESGAATIHALLRWGVATPEIRTGTTNLRFIDSTGGTERAQLTDGGVWTVGTGALSWDLTPGDSETPSLVSTSTLASSAGTNTSPARADHGHGFPASNWVTPAVLLGATAAAGTATTLLRSDCTIDAFDTTVPTALVFDVAAATGSINFAARRDHIHALTAPAAGYPVDVAATEADGSSANPARGDHRHAHGTGYLADAHHLARGSDSLPSGSYVLGHWGTAGVVAQRGTVTLNSGQTASGTGTWFYATGAVSFPQAFTGTPKIQVTAISNASRPIWHNIQAGTASASGFTVIGWCDATGLIDGTSSDWLAIGPM